MPWRQGGVDVYFTLILTTALVGFGWLTLRPDPFNHRNDPVRILYEAGWAPTAGLDECGKSLPHRDSTSDRPALIDALFQMTYPSWAEFLILSMLRGSSKGCNVLIQCFTTMHAIRNSVPSAIMSSAKVLASVTHIKTSSGWHCVPLRQAV
jgi:hypothetical protein